MNRHGSRWSADDPLITLTCDCGVQASFDLHDGAPSPYDAGWRWSGARHAYLCPACVAAAQLNRAWEDVP